MLLQPSLITGQAWDAVMQKCRCLLKIIIVAFFGIFALQKFLISPEKAPGKNNVPNIVHYVIFKNSSLDFITFLSITSVIKNHAPELILIHTNATTAVCAGRYWKLVQNLAVYFHVEIRPTFYDVPTHVYGQRLSSVYHASDVARLDILYKFGGIYLDTDSVVLKPLNEFFDYETTLACPENDYVGNQVIVAAKGSKFIHLWLQSYKQYQPTKWYLNAGQYPTTLLEHRPGLARKLVHEFGVQNLLDELYVQNNWQGWKTLYAIHLLSRHPPSPQFVNENTVFDNTFGEIVRWILFDVKPKLVIEKMSWSFIDI
ncbi:lactosylceramide 4-alpha-galactosyltransferase-like [Cimex lectularius]|uniref:Alpha-1,4-N-acetylglucosaminyltransferase n=1 Tax=Cimex lectularius TaxID=79782 RepID=A0A8I6RZV4_CIMLE|nr:lactosylceramide 4-alpha-galactosyltransferase-like [Cimex lectularius]